ncbi:MAG: amidohydrolase [Candidatus Omnitrophica bacterium]|nr:amidohydrolase [Candidatus Omnitrophota bacterium]
MILSRQEVRRILAEIKELKSDQPWIDFHVNPYEVIYNRFEHHPNPHAEGVWSLKPVPYSPPEITPLRIDDGPSEEYNSNNKDQLKSYYQLILQKHFFHIGHRVILDQMALSGIDKCVMLPVFQPATNGRREMEFMFKAYGKDERFILGYCIPNSVKEDEIADDIKRARQIYKIAAVKFNANIMAIDLAKPKGINRLRAILKACADYNLSLVIHGGRSELLWDSESRDYALLDNMADTLVNYSTGTTIISHAGFFGFKLREIKSDLMPLIENILCSNANIYLNTAGLELNVLKIIFNRIDSDRIVFGSDFPYFLQWGSLVKIWFIIKNLHNSNYNLFKKIISQNPQSILQGKDK